MLELFNTYTLIRLTHVCPGDVVAVVAIGYWRPNAQQAQGFNRKQMKSNKDTAACTPPRVGSESQRGYACYCPPQGIHQYPWPRTASGDSEAFLGEDKLLSTFIVVSTRPRIIRSQTRNERVEM